MNEISFDGSFGGLMTEILVEYFYNSFKTHLTDIGINPACHISPSQPSLYTLTKKNTAGDVWDLAQASFNS